MAIAAFLLALLPTMTGVLITSDFLQLLFKPTVRQVYLVLRLRSVLIGLSIALWGVGLALHYMVAPVSWWLIVGSGFLIVGAIVVGFLLPGYILFRSLNDPKTMKAKIADRFLQPEDIVIGVALSDQARAYPTKWVTRPHVVHDTLDGTKIAVTYCALSHRAVTLDRQLGDHEMRLTSPTQNENNLVLFDPGSGNMIQQIFGRVVEGPNKGEPIDTYPTLITTWAAWKSLHPHTDVLFHPPRSMFDYTIRKMLKKNIVDPHLNQEAPFFPTIRFHDDRLPSKTQVLGLCVDGSCMAYELNYLRSCRVLNTTVADTPLLVAYDADRDLGNVFHREHDGRVLSFGYEASETHGQLLIDKDTGHKWDMSGRAVAGTAEQSALRPFDHANRVLWFVWANFFPDTKLVV